MEEEEEFDEVDGVRPNVEQEQCHGEREGRAEEKRTRLRCCQHEREASGVQPGDMDAAAPTISDRPVSPISLHCLPHQSDDSMILDIEVTAEVRIEGSSSLALLPLAAPRLLRSGKPAFFCDQSPFILSHPSSIWTKGLDRGLMNLSSWPWQFNTGSAATMATVPGTVMTAKSPFPSPPCTSPSSPSSAPSSPSSSPSSSTSSPGSTVVGYHDNDRSRTEGGAVSSATGEAVSSTSVSLAPPAHLLPPSSGTSVHLSSSPCPVPGRASIEIYDPFHPTEGEADREGRASVEDDEEEDEEDMDKYDPFDPTGSPASERGRERGIEAEDENGVARKAMLLIETRVEGPGREKMRDRAPSVSTDPTVCRPREEREQARGRENKRERGKGGRERKEVDSDNSEIEEGEIVGAGDRERDRKRDKTGERVRAPDSPFLHSCRQPERILRVLDGDDFVSVRAEGNWALGRERDGVGDLRRKLVSRRKERFRSGPSSSLSPPLPLPLPVSSVPAPKEKERSRKSTRGSKDRERHKRKQDRGGEKPDRKRGKDDGSKEKKERDTERDGRRGQEEKRREEDRGRSSRSSSSKRKKRLTSPKRSSYSQSSSHRQKHRRHSSSSHSEDRRRDRDRERREEREWDKEQDSTKKSKRKRERGEQAEESGSRERRGGSRKNTKSNREQRERGRERDRNRDPERERWRRDGRPVVPPSIQDLNGSDLFAIKRTITVTTTTTTTTVPGSPPLPQATPDTPPQASDKPRKKKRKRKRREEKEDEEEEMPMSQSRDSSLTPLRYHDFDSDQFSDKLGVEVLSLDGEALDSDYPSLEDTPPHLPPPSPHPSPKPKVKSKTGRHVKKKSRTGKKTNLAETSHRPKSGKGLSSLSPPSVPSVNVPTKHIQKAGKEKGVKKEGGRSGKSKKLSRGTRKGKLQSKVSVLVRDGVSSTTGGSGVGKRGVVVGSSKDLSASSGSSSAGVVGGSIAVVFRRDNESRSPFLKPCSEPVSVSKGRKCGTLSALVPPSSSSSSSSSSSHLSVIKSKKAEPSSTTSASSSSASSPSSSSTTKQKRKQGKRERDHREKGGTIAEAGGADERCGIGGDTWGVPLLDTQSGLTPGGKPSSPPSRPQAVPSCSSSSSASASILPPSSSPPCSPPVTLPVSRDTRESTPDSQTVDSSCKTPEPPFVSDDITTQIQASPLIPLSNAPPSPPSLQTPLSGTPGVVQSCTDLKLPPEEQKAPTSPPCSSSSSANSTAASLNLSLPASSADHSSSASSSVSSSSTTKPPPPPPPGAPPLPWSLQTGVDCTAGGVLALTALLFKMEEANLASRAKAQEFIQATSQILSQANQSQTLPPSSSSSSSTSSQVAPLPSLAPPSVPTPAQFILHSSLPLVGCTKTPPPHLHPGLSLGAGCAQTPPLHSGSLGTTGVSSDTSWDGESKDPDKYLKKLHTQERAVEEVKLAIKPYYQRKDINKDEYKDILRKAVHKICHSRTGEINPVKVSNLVKLYVQRYKYFRKHGRKVGEDDRDGDRDPAALHSSS
ncbi:uncharacterized protein scaf1 [Paramormyrops kingsleyae]|uniref:uncharacterized protein scaf1 n=1 Tax=Paramormyrops kingsleyae TaxID=1676925 RepID=UPI003B96AEDF